MKTLASDMSARLLFDTGLLFEINRSVLHPHGLALFVEEEDGQMRIGGLLDSGEDLEGIVFDDASMVDDIAKLAVYEACDHARILSRQKALGYVVQPLPTRPAMDCDGETTEASCDSRSHAQTSTGSCGCGTVVYND